MDKPKKNYTTYRRELGHYDLAHPHVMDVQYIFTFGNKPANLDLRCGYVIDSDRDCCYRDDDDLCPLELAVWLESEYSRYIYAGSTLADIRKVVEYLQSVEEQEEVARHQYKIDYARYQVWYWQNELKKLRVV